MILAILLFVIGMALLIGGAKFLVSGASQLATICKISPLVIGLTVVAFGTSSPEIGVSVLAAWEGNGSLVIGNVVGSNIVNILLILGLCATITPLYVRKQLIWWDIPLLIILSSMLWLLASQGVLGRAVGISFLAGITLYIWITYTITQQENHTPPKEVSQPLWLQVVWIIFGLALLTIGSKLVINQSIILARLWQVQELFIGLTLVALGTSLPEIATSIVAVRQNEKDLAVGNLVGSNIFNILAVTGIAATIAPIKIPPTAVAFDFPVMVAVAIATLPIFLTGHKISRWEGIVFLLFYALYFTYLLLDALVHPWLPLFTSALFFFILPLTVLSLLIGLVRHFQRK